MKRLLVLFCSFGCLACPALLAQPELDKKLQALEKGLSPEQKRLLADYIDLQVRQRARYIDPSNLPVPAEVRAHALAVVAGMTPAQAKIFWRDLPFELKRGFRGLDLLHTTADERKAADGLPAAAEEEIAKLSGDDLDAVLAARRKILSYGPACRALVAAQTAKLAHNSAKRLRHEELLTKLDSEEYHERIMRFTETALQKAAKLDAAREKNKSTIAVLIARRLCDLGNRPGAYGKWCYYNFIHNNHEYEAGVALEFGNGQDDPLSVNFYGGQDNRLVNLGAVKYGDVKKAPGPETTAKWWKGFDAQRMAATKGHVYLLHVFDPNQKLDFTVKFKVLDMSTDEWIIIEWERIPQDN